MKTDETGKLVYLNAEVEINRDRGKKILSYLTEIDASYVAHGIPTMVEGQEGLLVQYIVIHGNTRLIFT